ncbi:MarR family winged helix-turn-helix transcriptional regulator [Parafrankia sp. BMG5.11]|nr:MarR family transcriptional regulator [Parafrankia sp. BMG5.11]TCJ32324.1 MarR family transcriptional regulator [Parafrankia sp. BMG5.11]CAI7978933.1 MarR family transcriptional regulator [Frankia sp. Hr75.2]SQE00300.1 Transcriptional regulator, MarR family [Parafrankia sp. Ea1.12]
MASTSPDAAPARLRHATHWLIAQLAKHAQRRSSHAFTALGAHPAHYALLAALDEFGPASQATLARRAALDRADTAGLLTDLRTRGLVERTPDATDRRRTVITLTDEGTTHLHHLDAVTAAIGDDLLAGLPPADRHQFTALLTRLLTDRPH